LDGNLLNFSAAPGAEPVISFEAPVVRPTPPAEERGFPVRRGNRFTRMFEPGLFARVIGADIKVEIAFPPGAAGAQLSGNVVLGADAIRLLLGFTQGHARFQLIVNNQSLAAVADFDPAAPLGIHARWHTHGQGQIWVNGSLRSYQPAQAPGQSFTIERLAFGHHDTSATAPAAPAFLIRRIGVKMLRDIDARRSLDGLFPIAEPTPLDPDCRRRLTKVQSAVLAEIRAFMQQAVTSLNSAWDGQPGGPFSPEAIAAHAAAMAAGNTFVAFMLHHPGGDPGLVVQKIDEFLTLVRATDPAAYDQAVARLQAMSQPSDPHCIALLHPLAQAHGGRLQPVVGLLQSLWAKMQAPGVTP
jgi:hypothetical protein